LNIEITIANEQEIIERYRLFLRSEARMIVADCPDRVGKRYAQVTFPGVEYRSLYPDADCVKVEFV